MIKVIILSKDVYLGDVGSIKKVKNGYARNFLIPYKKAVYATKLNLIKYGFSKKNIVDENIDKLKEKILSLSPLNISVRSENNKLFGSIKNIDISNLIYEKLSIKISRKNIIIPNFYIKYIGDYDISIYLSKKNFVSILLKIRTI